MFRSRRKLFSQNFLHDRKLVKQLIRNSSIGRNDLVVEIGAGKGLLTEELARQGNRIIAVEIDSNWYKYLQRKFYFRNNIHLVRADVLNYIFPQAPFKVFGNIPFYLEGRLVRKLLCLQSLQDCYLVVRKDVAYRWAGLLGNNLFQIMYLPWFDFKIYYHFHREDFLPSTRVEAVILRISKKSEFLLPYKQKDYFQRFIRISFENWRRSYSPANLSVEQWIDLYHTS